MAKTYSFTDKIAALLKKDHGITATVEDRNTTSSPGIVVTVGSYQETISGVITKDKIAALAERIKAAG